MSTQVRTSPAVAVATAGSPVPVGSGLVSNLTVSKVNVTPAGLATVTFTSAHGITNAGTSKITFWDIGTNTWLNQLTVSTVNVLSSTAIQFYTTSYSSATSGSDTGSAVVSPVERYRVLRVEIDSGASTGVIYVGDNQVSSIRYSAALSLAGQTAWELAGEGIDPCLVWIDTSANGTKAQVSLVY